LTPRSVLPPARVPGSSSRRRAQQPGSAGSGDVLVGANYSSDYGEAAGAAWLFYGPLSGTYSPADAPAGFFGESASGQLGATLAAGTDVTGDGILDLVFGAREAVGDADESGAIYVAPGVAP
jgi:hypothetical protein